MSTLDGPIRSKYSIALTYPARPHFQLTLRRKDRANAMMNVTAHQEKKKNDETKTGMKKAGERRRQLTDFGKAVCCHSAVVQGAARRKNGLRGVPW